MSDINITPLLDLAFVLLIIFIITTPLIEHGLDLNLPQGGAQETELTQKDIHLVEIGQNAQLALNNRRVSYRQLVGQLTLAARANPKMVVRIRADENAPYKYVIAVIDALQKRGVSRFNFATEPAG